METVLHEIEPVYDEHSRVLVLGSMPSPKSREQGFYYGHPQNRFWRVLAAVLEVPVPVGIEEKKALLLRNRIALWDVLSRCEIKGAADSSIANPQPNDFARIFTAAKIEQVFTTGKAAAKLYERLTGRGSICLPSTSPANCRVPFDKLVEEYRAGLLPWLS